MVRHLYRTLPPGSWRGPPPDGITPDDPLTIQICHTRRRPDGWVEVEGWVYGPDDTDVTPVRGLEVDAAEIDGMIADLGQPASR